MYAVFNFGAISDNKNSAVEFNTAGGAVDPVNRSTYTFSLTGFSNPAPNRHMLACVFVDRNAATIISSVTIAGQSTTALASMNEGTFHRLAWYITNSPVTSGTTATVVINNSAANACIVQGFEVSGLQSISPVATYSNTSSNGSFTPTIEAGGLIFAAAYNNGNTSFSWSNATERAELNESTENSYLSLATADEESTITQTSISSDRMMLAISLR